MKFRFKKRSRAEESFRVSSIMGKYDLTSADIVESFQGEIPIEGEDWNVGVIYGNSGTGKTQIAKNLFPEFLFDRFEYTGSCVLDDFPSACRSDEIIRALNAVGFTTAKSWLKPYRVLSNGEKMRVDLARAILENQELTVFDEFTSVVDRKVAKVGSFAVQKAVRRLNKKFIAVSCHDDIIDWLEPDWVFCTNDMSFTFTRGELRRPKIKLELYEVKGFWPLFRKYHYVNHSLLSCAREFVAFYENEPVAYGAVVPLVHNTIRNGVRGHRLVVLPDYQGIGAGQFLVNGVSEYFHKQKKRYFSNTSHPAVIAFYSKSENWQMTRNISHAAKHAGMLKGAEGSARRLTSGWEYKSPIYKRRGGKSET